MSGNDMLCPACGRHHHAVEPCEPGTIEIDGPRLRELISRANEPTARELLAALRSRDVDLCVNGDEGWRMVGAGEPWRNAPSYSDDGILAALGLSVSEQPRTKFARGDTVEHWNPRERRWERATVENVTSNESSTHPYGIVFEHSGEAIGAREKDMRRPAVTTCGSGYCQLEGL